MKRARDILSILAITLLAGCQQPSDIEVAPASADQAGVEIVPVVVPDTASSGAWSDSTAILPLEQSLRGGSFLLNRVTHDTGTGSVTFALARAFFADSAVQMWGKNCGFSGRDLGPIAFNGGLMLRYPHVLHARTNLGTDTALARGVAYVSNATQTYAPNREYSWVLNPAGSRFVTVSVRTPDDLVVRAPLGGTRVPRTQDLELRWTGANGRMDIVISTYEPMRRKSRPILTLNPPAGAGRVVLPARLLSGLPATARFYIITFILSNRTESISVPQYPARVFARAADVYNSYIEIR